TATTTGDALPKHCGGCKRKLDDLAAGWRGNVARGTRGVWNAVTIMTNREDAGVVLKTQIDQIIQRPQRLCSDGIAGCPISAHRLAGEVLQQCLAVPGLLAKCGPFLVVDQLVTPSMTGDLVTAPRDLA